MKRAVLMTAGTVIGVSLIVAGGCAPPGENLVAAGKVVVEKQSLGSVRVSRVKVYQDGVMLVVDGSLRRSGSHRQGSLGHIDIAVLAPDGTMLAQKSVRDIWSNCYGPSFFKARMPLAPPKGSTVRVLFHDSTTVPASGHTHEEWQALWKTAPETPG